MYQKTKNSWAKHLDFMIWDMICLQLAFLLAYILWQKDIDLYSNFIYANLSIVLLLIDICLLIFLGTLKNVLKRGALVEFAATIKQVALLTLVAVLYLFSVKTAGDFSRMTLFLTAIFYGILSYAVRMLWKRYVLRRIKLGQQKSILIITDMEQLKRVEHDILGQSYAMFQVSGIVVMDLPQADAAGEEYRKPIPEDNPVEIDFESEEMFVNLHVGDTIHGIPIVADGHTAIEYICRKWVDEVFVDFRAKSPLLEPLVNQLTEMGVTIHIKLVERLELNNQRQFIEKIGKYTVLTTSINTASGTALLLKRTIDIIGGMIGCVITGVLFVFLAPAIYIQSPGPIFFSQTRVGKNGRKFKLYKFRSMYLDAEERKAELMKDNRVEDGMMFKLDYDPRIIGCKKLPDGTVKKGLGNWMRDWSIDEFPQFWNVLKGDMSLVGTRPPTEDEWVRYDLHHRSRLAVKPGITGMWQVSGRSNVTDFEKVVELDRYYITNWSLTLDLKILGKTIPVVFGREGSM